MTILEWFRPRSGPPPRDLISAELERALEEEGCPLCRIARAQEERYLQGFLWENVTDPEVRDRLRADLGYCPRHTWLMFDLEHRLWGTASGTATLLHDLLTVVTGRLARPRLSASIAPPTMICVADRLRRQHERTHAAWLLRHLARPEFLSLYRRNGGLCRYHLRLIPGARSAVAPVLIETARSNLGRRLKDSDLVDFLYGQVARQVPPVQSEAHPPRNAHDLPCPRCVDYLRREEEAIVRVITTDDESSSLCDHHGLAVGAKLRDPQLRDQTRAFLQRQRMLTEPRLGEQLLAEDHPRIRISFLRPSRGRPDSGSVSPECPVCRAATETEYDRLRVLTDRSVALCLPHLQLALAATSTEEARTWTRSALHTLDPLNHGLEEYLRKSSWDNRDEPKGDDLPAPHRAVRAFAGERMVW